MTAFTPDPALAYPCAPQRGRTFSGSLGRRVFSVGYRRDLPAETRIVREPYMLELRVGHFHLGTYR